MELTVKIAGLNKEDPRYRLMLDKKAELQAICQGYEDMLKEQLPQYAIDGVLPAVQIVPDRKTMEVLKGLFKMISVGVFENQPQFEWAVKNGALPCRKVSCRVAGAMGFSFYVCGLPKKFPADKWKILSKSIGEFYIRWTDGCDILPGLIYQLRDK